MKSENRAMGFLRRHQLWLLLAMSTASLTNVFARFVGDWKSFWTVLFLQVFFGQAVFAYIRGTAIQVAPGGRLSKNADPLARAGVAALSLAIYFLAFAYEPREPEQSIYEKRASDWSMPTREELRRPAE
ncbi:hypothetical protein BSZ28_18420 [Pseudomonas moraviensis]|nr:hypothetical protein BSZ28_18420 [Pseudomonas moraviensis]